MFFKAYFNSVAEILEARLKGNEYDSLNANDKGELCEVFIKEFLIDSLSDNYNVFRGGKIVNCLGQKSKQIDIVLCSKRVIRIFSDKGLYPTETVKGVFSITATLDIKKLFHCMAEFASIPKTNYHFTAQKFLPERFKEDTQRIFEDLTPFTCVFAYRGNINKVWVKKILNWIRMNKPNHSLTPDLIFVNKVGMIKKIVKKIEDKKLQFDYVFIDFKQTLNPGSGFTQLLFDLYNFSNEDLYLQPDYTEYFNADLE